MGDQEKAYIYGMITVVLWSTVASAFKLSLRYMDHIQLLLYSCIVSLLTLSIIMLIQGRFGILFSFVPGQYLRSLALGFLNPFLYYLVLFKAYDLLPAQEAQPLNYTWAITLTFLSIPLLGQRIGARDIIGAFISYSGVLVISTHGDITSFRFSDPLGVALALGSTLIWSLYWIYNMKDDRDPVAGLLLNFLFGLPFILGFCLLFSDIHVASTRGLLGACYVGVFEMGITFVTWFSALKLSEHTAKVGNLIFISPFLSLIFIHFIVGEGIMPSTFFGLALIVAGLIFQRFRSFFPGRKSKGDGNS